MLWFSGGHSHAKISSSNSFNQLPFKTIRVGVDHKNPPFEFVDAEGRPTGFNIDLLRSLAQVMGLTLDIVVGPWDEIRASLEEGRLDMVSGMYFSEERDLKVDFSVPFFIVYESMFTRSDSPFNEMEDLKNREIIVQSGDIMHDYLLSNRITDSIVEVKNTLDGIHLLAAGKHDSALLSKLQGQFLLKKYKIKNVKAAGPAIMAQKYCFAVSEGDKELVAILDQGLSILKSSGKYKEIRETWFGVLEGSNYQFLYRVVLAVLLGVLLLLFVFWLWAWYLRRHVRRKTRLLADELSAHQDTLALLIDKEAHLRALVESSPDAILVLDKNFCMTDCNPAFNKQLGFDQGEIIGRPLSLILSSEDEGVVFEQNAFKDISENGVAQDQRMYRQKSGSLVPMETTVSEKILPDGRLEGYVAMMRNISKRKQAEEEKARLEDQLRQVYKMEAIGTLAAGIAHDFNNILSSIIGYGELAKRALNSNSQACQDIAEVLESADRAKGLVRQILTYSRRAEQERRPEYLTSLVKGALRLLKASLPANVEITIDVRVEEDLVLADVTQVNQVIINLVTNAAHAIGSDQGFIDITLRNIQVEEETVALPALMPGRHIELIVADNGHGIDKTIQERMFDPFFTTKQRGEGTGMGLSVVHGIIKDHGGFIKVDSRLGEGTSFQVIFPLYDGSFTESRLPGPIIGGNECILFIDDEKKVVNAWKRILTSLGYHVVSFTSPCRALELFDKFPEEFDAVITDLDMHEMNGLELISALQDIREDIKIIIHTGFRSKGDELAAIRLGVTRCLYKPASAESMAEALRTIIDDQTDANVLSGL